jgi:hypothetical protein
MLAQSYASSRGLAGIDGGFASGSEVFISIAFAITCHVDVNVKREARDLRVLLGFQCVLFPNKMCLPVCAASPSVFP